MPLLSMPGSTLRLRRAAISYVKASRRIGRTLTSVPAHAVFVL
ncbi:hypothetical protein ACS15_2705 [Ralstonia insidiosa]|uniref:Uncharacterized protein n=1 Tax=Ralstonia insidiosa TaxID=190721 RepID=A0AAC9FQC4_9RALS|nr:hypothetical protein ACS15_2705 [Ralstonia insidiosa]